MESERTVSVVMPVRNRERHVSYAVQSILRQTIPVQEIIIVNDGSTDSTGAVLDELARVHPAVKAIHLQKSGGAAAARNIGIENATSVWIAFLDSDDAWLPEKLQLQLAAADEQNGTIGVFTGIRYVETISDENGPGYNYLPDREASLQSLRRLNHLSSTSTAVIKRDALNKVGGFDPTLPSCQDWDLWLKLAEVGPFEVVRSPLTICSFGNSDRISRNIKSVLAGHQIVFEKIYQADPTPKAVRVNRAYHEARLAQIYLLDLDDPFESLRHSVSSLSRHPTTLAWTMFKRASRRCLRQSLTALRGKAQ